MATRPRAVAPQRCRKGVRWGFAPALASRKAERGQIYFHAPGKVKQLKIELASARESICLPFPVSVRK